MFSQGSPINIENAVLHWGPEKESEINRPSIGLMSPIL